MDNIERYFHKSLSLKFIVQLSYFYDKILDPVEQNSLSYWKKITIIVIHEIW